MTKPEPLLVASVDDDDAGYCGTFCSPCLACQLSDRLDENTCLPLCIGIVPLRQKIRMILGIRVRSILVIIVRML